MSIIIKASRETFKLSFLIKDITSKIILRSIDKIKIINMTLVKNILIKFIEKRNEIKRIIGNINKKNEDHPNLFFINKTKKDA